MDPKKNTKVKPLAFIEQAIISGLQMVPINERNPFITNSKGIGETILDAYTKGAREIYLGIGGSATVDFGIGAIHALGVKLYRKGGVLIGKDEILCGKDLKDIEDLEYDAKKLMLKDLKLHMVCDVNNPLLGPNGAVYVYAKQKGASDSDLPILEGYMKKFSDLLKKKSNGKLNLDNIPKMGAAGAIGAGLSTFINSEFHSGIELIAELLGLEDAIKDSDAVITGEGAFDTQTLEGKTVSHVIKTAQKHNKKVIIICGVNKVPNDITEKLKIDVYDLKSRFDIDTCFNKTEDCIKEIIEKEIKPTLL